jgi:hypothetical protein
MELTFSIFFEIFHVYELVATRLSGLAHTNILYLYFAKKKRRKSQIIEKVKKRSQW